MLLLLVDAGRDSLLGVLLHRVLELGRVYVPHASLGVSLSLLLQGLYLMLKDSFVGIRLVDRDVISHLAQGNTSD